MIYRTLKFEVLYDVGTAGAPDWKREAVAEMLCTPEFGVTSVKTVTDVELALDPLKVSLLQSTGTFDKIGREIFHADILADEKAGEIYQVIFAEGCFYLSRNEAIYPLENERVMKLKVIGDSIRNEKLLMPEKPVDQLMEESKGRKILPPIVSLKKK